VSFSYLFSTIVFLFFQAAAEARSQSHPSHLIPENITTPAHCAGGLAAEDNEAKGMQAIRLTRVTRLISLK